MMFWKKKEEPKPFDLNEHVVTCENCGHLIFKKNAKTRRETAQKPYYEKTLYYCNGHEPKWSRVEVRPNYNGIFIQSYSFYYFLDGIPCNENGEIKK